MSDVTVDDTPEAKAAFLSELKAFEGVEIGPPVPAPDEVNAPMIRHWCEAMGDTNPIYTDPDAAARSAHGGLVAPPTMLQAWVMHGLSGRPRDEDDPYEQMTRLLFSRGFTSVVGTNSEQTYERYLRPGDRLTMRTVIDSISDEKATGMGVGHFVTTRQDYYDADNAVVGSMKFRILRFRPKVATPPAKPKPLRPRPATTHDNGWWFDALAAGRLVAQRCSDCGRVRFPTGPMCPSCHSLRWEEHPLAPEGTIHSFVVAHYPQVPSFDYPLPILLVELADGVRMTMNPIDADPGELAIGRKVRVEIIATDPDLSLPFARLEATA